MEPHSPKSPRFSDTPPGSPKSCMKGSRKLTFDKPGDVVVGPGGNPSPIPSPKKSPKSVSIRMHEAGTTTTQASVGTQSEASQASPRFQDKSSKQMGGKAPPPAEIQFQFELTEHFDQSTPPPNCTSNGNYDFEGEEAKTGSSTPEQYDDPRKDPQLVEIATKFVNDIIETAKVEAADRAKAEEAKGKATGTSDRDSFSEVGRGATHFIRQARGIVSKWFTNICVRAQNIRADLK